MSRFPRKLPNGFTLIEMVVALGLSLVTVSAVYSLYVSELMSQYVREVGWKCSSKHGSSWMS